MDTPPIITFSGENTTREERGAYVTEYEATPRSLPAQRKQYTKGLISNPLANTISQNDVDCLNEDTFRFNQGASIYAGREHFRQSKSSHKSLKASLLNRMRNRNHTSTSSSIYDKRPSKVSIASSIDTSTVGLEDNSLRYPIVSRRSKGTSIRCNWTYHPRISKMFAKNEKVRNIF